MIRKTIKISLCVLFFATIFFIGLMLFYVDFSKVNAFSSAGSITEDELRDICDKNYFGNFVKADANIQVTSNRQAQIDIKFFNLFKIKRVAVDIKDSAEVLACGDVLSFNLNLNGALVTATAEVNTENGKVRTYTEKELKIGDYIKKVDNIEVKCALDVVEAVKQSEKEIELEVLRKNKINKVVITPAVDLSGNKKIGVWIKDDSGGIGTLSFVDKATNKFVALGHQIIDAETAEKALVINGDMYPSKVVGVKRSENGIVGELKAINIVNSESLGEVNKNEEFGIFGVIKNKNFLLNKSAFKVAGRYSVKPGKASILTCIDGVNPQFFDIEIVKASVQKAGQSKGLIIKIKDKKLLASCGGIVQGMSGSPIIQNNKVVGVLTHMFVNNPVMGYGIYAEWLLSNIKT